MDTRGRGKEKEEAEKSKQNENKEQSGLAAGHGGEAGGSATVQPRLYECVFCKGSFTSAQALGGHMNVHRRERARLKESLSITLSAPHEQPAIMPSQRSPVSLAVPYDQAVSSSISPRFYATRSREKQGESSDENLQAKGGKDLKQGDEELDLELRLGEKPGKK
ncbi:hypothetical protein SUGI_0863000 [Cryptomeria japonica]|nr:hypothetical protein SUGI_0863000 [Cryptomeria japonica]